MSRTYQVVVGNIGTVYDGPRADDALAIAGEYIAQSMAEYGRAAGEPVTVFRDGEPWHTYNPPPDWSGS